MAELYKTEFHVFTADDDRNAIDWCDTKASAIASLGDRPGRVDRVKYYHNDTETVFEREPEA